MREKFYKTLIEPISPHSGGNIFAVRDNPPKRYVFSILYKMFTAGINKSEAWSNEVSSFFW